MAALSYGYRVAIAWPSCGRRMVIISCDISLYGHPCGQSMIIVGSFMWPLQSHHAGIIWASYGRNMVDLWPSYCHRVVVAYDHRLAPTGAKRPPTPRACWPALANSRARGSRPETRLSALNPSPQTVPKLHTVSAYGFGCSACPPARGPGQRLRLGFWLRVQGVVPHVVVHARA